MEIDNSWRYELKETDRFSFNCSTCGECCRGDMLIRLNLFDLQKMLRFVGGEKTGDLFERGFVDEELIENGGFRPFIRFKKASGIAFCPFLENRLNDDHSLVGLCQLHPHKKPLVCNLAPFGRVIQGSETHYYFTEPISGCPGCKSDKTNHVAALLDEHEEELQLEEMYFEVMEELQEKKVGIDGFREFHRGLKVDDDIQGYLSRWKGC